jgi:Uma2 family endonuclease
MGLAQKDIAYIEPEEYLVLENASQEKHEYLDGVIYALHGNDAQGMAGAPLDHAQVCMNAFVALRAQIKGKGVDCKVFTSDVRLKPYRDTAYFYPDLMVHCGGGLNMKAMHLDAACLVIEVLSATTEKFDRGDKFQRYQLMPALESYVLIHPRRQTIEVFRRDQEWAVSGLTTAGQLARLPHDALDTAPIDLGTHGFTLRAADVFADL